MVQWEIPRAHKSETLKSYFGAYGTINQSLRNNILELFEQYFRVYGITNQSL